MQHHGRPIADGIDAAKLVAMGDIMGPQEQFRRDPFVALCISEVGEWLEDERAQPGRTERDSGPTRGSRGAAGQAQGLVHDRMHAYARASIARPNNRKGAPMRLGIMIGIAAMATVVVASNILVQFLFGDWLTWGAFTYPVAFLVTDLTNRTYGPRCARQVVFAGFAVGIACSFAGTLIEGEFGPLVTYRIALGSGIAFLSAQLLDVLVFDRLRHGRWWRAPLLSSFMGSTLDTALFFTIAFSASLSMLEPTNDVSWAGERLPLIGFGPVVPLWVSLATADLMVKLSIALVALIPFRLIARNLPNPAV